MAFLGGGGNLGDVTPAASTVPRARARQAWDRSGRDGQALVAGPGLRSSGDSGLGRPVAQAAAGTAAAARAQRREHRRQRIADHLLEACSAASERARRRPRSAHPTATTGRLDGQSVGGGRGRHRAKGPPRTRSCGAPAPRARRRLRRCYGGGTAKARAFEFGARRARARSLVPMLGGGRAAHATAGSRAAHGTAHTRARERESGRGRRRVRVAPVLLA